MARRRGATFPDFIVRIDDGGDEPLNLVLEIKGFRGARRATQGRDDARRSGFPASTISARTAAGRSRSSPIRSRFRRHSTSSSTTRAPPIPVKEDA